VETSPVVYLETGCFAVAHLQGAAADDLDRSDQHASGQTIHVDVEPGGDPGYFLRFDPVLPGIDPDPFPEMGRLRPYLDGLVT
jgi:hypothetical protein